MVSGSLSLPPYFGIRYSKSYTAYKIVGEGLRDKPQHPKGVLISHTENRVSGGGKVEGSGFALALSHRASYHLQNEMWQRVRKIQPLKHDNFCLTQFGHFLIHKEPLWPLARPWVWPHSSQSEGQEELLWAFISWVDVSTQLLYVIIWQPCVAALVVISQMGSLRPC